VASEANEYSAADITVLEFDEAVRKRPGMYFGVGPTDPRLATRVLSAVVGGTFHPPAKVAPVHSPVLAGLRPTGPPTEFAGPAGEGTRVAYLLDTGYLDPASAITTDLGGLDLHGPEPHGQVSGLAMMWPIRWNLRTGAVRELDEPAEASNAVSDDGRVVVGQSDDASGTIKPIEWRCH
jgi:hypothetical protein